MGETRVCTKCGQNKPVEEFPWKYSDRGIRHAVCKPCTADRSSRYYHDNPKAHQEQIDRVMRQKVIDRQTARDFVWDYLSSHPCIDCGASNPVVLEFDHVGNKKETVARLVADGATIKRIQEEISQCVVRCANCHRVKTAKERGWFRK